MSTLKESNAAYFGYMIVNFMWYTCLLAGILTPVILGLAYWGNTPLGDTKLSIPISTEVLRFSPGDDVSYINVDSAVASVQVSHLAENFPSTFLVVSLLLLAAMGITLFGIYQLRGLLKSIRNDVVFIPKNISRIKYLSIVALVLSPLEWFYHLALRGPFQAYVQNYRVELNIGSADIGFITAALLIYTLALVFEKGYEQYEELKLTV